MGGFECSSHCLKTGKRLDLIGATDHDRYAPLDYRRLQELGIKTARDGLRWHLIEPRPYHYDFSSVIPMIQAAQETRTQVIWDICHYGWPMDLDVFAPEFVNRFTSLSREFTRVLTQESDEVPYLAPINEISFLAWAGGDVGYINPFARGRGNELKVQMVRATIEAIEGIWDVCPQARIASIDPLIHIIPRPGEPAEEIAEAAAYNRVQFEAWDMLAGRLSPELGGKEKYLDIIGVNFYDRNEWFHYGPPVSRSEPEYRPFRELLQDAYDRYRRPLFVAETGIEDEARPEWLAYISEEVVGALQNGVHIEGLCLYPVLNHPGWDDDRHCYNGLWDYADERGGRERYEPLAQEVMLQSARIQRVLAGEAASVDRVGVTV
ncbi:MAG TPA: hypothetical protein VMZ52_08490 [Bryobacteraceae bacterium]|nr:hypothetical protein [Bryobacteraceae bacterium]